MFNFVKLDKKYIFDRCTPNHAGRERENDMQEEKNVKETCSRYSFCTQGFVFDWSKWNHADDVLCHVISAWNALIRN